MKVRRTEFVFVWVSSEKPRSSGWEGEEGLQLREDEEACASKLGRLAAAAAMAMAEEGSRNAAELIAQDNAAPAPSTARANLSSIMPGWFSEVSPMWPGTGCFQLQSLSSGFFCLLDPLFFFPVCSLDYFVSVSVRGVHFCEVLFIVFYLS